MYTDGQFDDARLAITLAQTAADLGAVVANYMPVVRLVRTLQRVTGVIVRDAETGNELELRSRVVLNATGVLADDIMKMDDDPIHPQSSNDRPLVVPSQGSHLVLDASFLPGSSALMIPETDDGRVLFAIPWHGKILLGTTDIAVKNVIREPRPLPEETAYLLDYAGRYLQRVPVESDVLSRFAGLRPLVGRRSGSTKTSKLSREHEIHTSSSGLITVIGGKWTTYRQMGEDLVDHAETSAGLPRKQSRTASLKLHGWPCDAATCGTQPGNVYGSDFDKIESLILQDPELAKPIHPRLPYQAVNVIWAARLEMAQTIEDVLARRTRSLFLDAKAALESAEFVGNLLQHELTRSDDWRLNQIRQFGAVARGYC